METVLHPLIEANRRKAQRLAPHAYAILELAQDHAVDAETLNYAVMQIERALGDPQQMGARFVSMRVGLWQWS